MNIHNLDPMLLVEGVFMALYLCFIFIMAGIDIENRKIEKSISMYGVLLSIVYILYLCMIEQEYIYRYVIYLALYVIILILDTVTLKRYAKNSYAYGLIFTVLTMAIFTGEYVVMNTIIMTALVVAIKLLMHKMKNIGKRIRREQKDYGKNISYGFILGITNILNLIFVLAWYKFFV